MILALDLGTRTGWALWDGSRTESGVQVFDLKRGESPGMRFVRFNGWLSSWAPNGHRPALVAYEQTHHRGGAATEIAAGFATRIQEFCARHGIEHTAVHSATLKKWTTGKGNADKRAMVAAVARRWKAVEDDNEADAIALLHYALGELVSPVMAGR
jgi:Holliday junction resolvasome RuvABC endonuclease subunit